MKQEQVLAFAGILQAASLTERLANTGHIENKYLQTAISGLLCQNPHSPTDVFGKVSHVEQGLTTLQASLEKETKLSNHIIRYWMSMIYLEKKLRKTPDLLNIIASRLKNTQEKVAHFGLTHENVIGNIADIYTDTISTLPLRIQVKGDPGFLQQSHIANQIRLLLFFGIRSVVLWRQLGGSRLHLLFQRKAFKRYCRALLAVAKNETFD